MKEALFTSSGLLKHSIAAAVCLALVCAILAGCAATGPAKDSDGTEEPRWVISEEEQAQIKQDYLEFSQHSCTVKDVRLVVISHIDPGYAVVIGCKCGGMGLNTSWQNLHGESAGDLQFYMPDSWVIMFCKDGEFRTLSEAYNSAWLNYSQLRTIWYDYHAQFPKALEKWQQINVGLTEPPVRDSSGLDYEVNADGVTCTITGMGVCNDKDVVIPEYIDGYQVTAIGKMAFWSQIRITSLTMPDSVVSIGSSAFEFCDQLERITLSASLNQIAIHAFKDCKALKSIHLPDSLTSIGGGAFVDCVSLTEITIPDQVTSISSGMFRNCDKLELLTLPGGITEIADRAFEGCPKLVIIEYKGTTAQWESIQKDAPWSEGAPTCNVHCSDGGVLENEY